MTNRKRIFIYLQQRFSSAYFLNLARKPPIFTIFIENNSYNLSVAFKEFTGNLFSYPFVLFSVDDAFFSTTSSFLTNKAETQVYYYLLLLFSMLYRLPDID
jgi:hypothetical protein